MNVKNLQWRANNSLLRSQIDDQLKPWLCDNNSLTAMLKGLGGDTFHVELLTQTITRPSISESRKMSMPDGRAATLREVYLHINGEPVVFARSVIPLSLSGRGGGGLATLGQTPLGHLLFKNGRIRVSKRDLIIQSQQSWLLAARRTPYEYLGHMILVSEYFLPALKRYL